jgi:rare lipoprotein A (peptidoglycan hydrolase)
MRWPRRSTPASLLIDVLAGTAVVALVAIAGQRAAQARQPAPPLRAVASAYGPGLFGNTTACGQTLWATTVGVASKSLPCGTRLQFRAQSGRWIPARVIDRGPYVYGRSFDLSYALVRALGYPSCRMFGVRTVTYRRA